MTQTLVIVVLFVAAMAALAGVRPGICMMAVPNLIFSVRAPSQAKGVTASEP